MLTCSWKESFGVECPSCGAQRSIEALYHGHVTESLSYFPALIPFAILIFLAAIHIIWPRKTNVKWLLYSMFLTAGLMLGNWISKLF